MRRIFITFSLCILVLPFPSPASAQVCLINGAETQGYTQAECQARGGIWLASPSDSITLQNPLGEDITPQILIGKIINAALGIVGSLALAMFIYGGFTCMLSAGNNIRVQKGKRTLIWAVLGLAVIFLAYALVRFMFTGLGLE